MICYSSTDRRLYLVKKLGGYYSGSGSSYHRFGRLRQKHFLRNDFSVFLLKVPDFALITINADGTWITNNAMSNYYGAPSVQYFDIERKIHGSSSWHYISINTNTISTAANKALIFDSSTDENSDMILAIRFVGTIPFSTFPSSTNCYI